MKKYEFLTNVTPEEATEKIIEALKKQGTRMGTEKIPVRTANGRVTAKAYYARRSSPHYLASAMDGIAVLAEDTVGASESNPVTLDESRYVMVDTGDPVPEGKDCVIMIENVIETEPSDEHGIRGPVRIYSASAPWSHIRQVGEDICMGDMVAPSYTEVTPAMTGAFIAAGIYEVEVLRKPVFGLIPSGDEIVDGNTDSIDLEPGDIPEYNSAIFSAMLSNWGCETKIYPVVKDRMDLIEDAVKKACEECDGIITIAGSSAGRDDYTSTVLENLGELLVHGVSIKPGKPAVIGNIGKKAFIGVPGYPVSGIIVMEEIVSHIAEFLTKKPLPEKPSVAAEVSRKVTSSLKYREYIRARAATVNGRVIAVPMARGAGVVTGFAKATGMFRIPQNSEGLEAGTPVKLELMRPEKEIETAVCVTGSHDPLIDEISDILIRGDNPVNVVSSHVGSMGAIMALRNGEAHLGGIHLLDMETGEYNRSYVEKYFPEGGVTLVRAVNRVQGIMVKKGNPKNIQGIKDLKKGNGKDVSYVNRQRGAGTRILLDYLMEKENMVPDDIYGYTREEYTHTAVAAAIANGGADAGLGIYSAAKTYGLDFIPLWDEEYDFLVLNSSLEKPEVKEFIDVMKGSEFRERLENLGGYNFVVPGEIIEEY